MKSTRHLLGPALLGLFSNLACADNGASGPELMSAGDFQGAARVLQAEAARHPRDVDTWFLLGVVRQLLEDHAGAIAAFEQVLAIDPANQDVQLPLGVSRLATKDAAGAVVALTEATRIAPADGTAWLTLGLAQQATGQLQAALASFHKAASLDPALGQAALLNAGLVERQLGRAAQSRRTLNEAARLDPVSDLGSTANEMLAAEKTSAPEARRWRLGLRAGAEYDDNVTTSEVDLQTGESDVAAVFETSAAWTALKNERSEVELSYDLYQSLYSRLDDFDLQLHTGGLYMSHNLGKVDASANYQFTHALLGDEGFFDIHRIRPSAGISLLDSLYQSLSYSYSDKDFTEDDARDADQHGVDLDSYYFFADGRSFAYFGARLEDEDTRGDEFDYGAYYLNAGITGYITPLPQAPTRVNVGYQYFMRDYDDVTPSIGDEREDQRHTLTVNLTQPIDRHFAALLTYQHISADSNLAASDYDENIVTLNLEYKF